MATRDAAARTRLAEAEAAAAAQFTNGADIPTIATDLDQPVAAVTQWLTDAGHRPQQP